MSLKGVSRLLLAVLNVLVALLVAGVIVNSQRGWDSIAALILLPAGGALAAELIGAFLWDEKAYGTDSVLKRVLISFGVMAVVGGLYGFVALIAINSFVPVQAVTITGVSRQVTLEFTLEGEKPDAAYVYVQTLVGLYPTRATDDGAMWKATVQLGPPDAVQGSEDCNANYPVRLVAVNEDAIPQMEGLVARANANGAAQGVPYQDLPRRREIRLPMVLRRSPSTCLPN